MHLVSLRVPAGEAELAADALWQAGAAAVTESTDGGRAVVAAAIDGGEVDTSAHPRWERSVEPLDPAEPWLDAWRLHARPVRAGRIIVQPAWIVPAPPRPDDVVVVIDPERAFGSGAHPSTRLALELLEQTLAPGDLVLDVGCGSGVLAVAAARLGASSVIAIDVDPHAVDVTRRNARRNGVADCVRASTTPLAEVEPNRFDLAVANIEAGVLRDLAPRLAARAPTVVLAGMLIGQPVDVPGHDVVAQPELDGWRAVAAQAPTTRQTGPSRPST